MLKRKEQDTITLPNKKYKFLFCLIQSKVQFAQRITHEIGDSGLLQEPLRRLEFIFVWNKQSPVSVELVETPSDSQPSPLATEGFGRAYQKIFSSNRKTDKKVS